MSPLHGRARNAQVPERPTAPPPPPPAPRHVVEIAQAHAVADLALRKAAAFDDLARWLTEQSGAAEYTDAMGPEWVVSTVKGRVGSLIEDGRDFRAGKRRPAWLRRTGW